MSEKDPKEELKRYLKKLQDFKNSNGKSVPYEILLSLKTYIGTLNIDSETKERLLVNMEYLRSQSNLVEVWLLDHEDLSEKLTWVLNEAYDKLTIFLEEIIERTIPIMHKPTTITENKKTKSHSFFSKLKNIGKIQNEYNVNGSDAKDFESLDIESYEDRYKYKIQVFISHVFNEKDIQLARTLKKLLERRGIYGYIAEVRPEFELPLDKKIQKEIVDAHYVIGIITHDSKASSSVNQELGYALGKDISLILMVEKNVKHGVLTTPREIQEFTQDNFSQVCKRIIDYILERDIPKKITGEEKKWLIDNVYRPCYDSMMNVYKMKFIDGIPDDPWERLTAYAKLKTEPDMKELFENYAKELKMWSTMRIDFENSFQNKRDNVANILIPVFQRTGLADEIGRIDNGEGSTWGLQDWVHNCNDVLFDNRIQNEEDLYQSLRKDMIRRWGRFYGMLDKWKKEKPGIYAEILKLIPEFIRVLGAKYSYHQIDEQRQILKESIEKLTLALEDKLK